MTIPSLSELEESLDLIAIEARQVVSQILIEAALKGRIKDGQLNDCSSIGSCVMHLDRRKPLYKFLASIPYEPSKFYFIEARDRSVSITLRNLNAGQSYELNRAAYTLVVKRLNEMYGWEVFNDVNID